MTMIQNIKPLWQFIAEANAARINCENQGNAFSQVWADRLETVARDMLPAGSGFDSGTRVDLDASKPGRVVLNTAFHHMNPGGFYDGWTYHNIVLTPAFGFPIVRITGRDRNGIKDYLAEVFAASLAARVGYVADPAEPGGARPVAVPDHPTLSAADARATACCLWEAALDAYRETGRAVSPAWVQDMRAHWEDWGTCEMRDRVAALAEQADSGWRAAQETGFDSPFDWEFCPWFLAACLDWTDGPTLVPDWLEKCREIGRADGARGGAAIDALDTINNGEPV